MHDHVRDHLLQLADKLRRAVLPLLYEAQAVLPNARQLHAFEQILLNQSNQLYARRRGDERFALLADILPLEERLDNGGAGRGAADAVLLQCLAQALVVHHLARRLHSAEQRGLGVGLGRLCSLLREPRLVRAAFPFRESRERALLGVVGGGVFGGCLIVRLISRHARRARCRHVAPARLENLLARSAEVHAGGLARDGRCGEFTVGIEVLDKTAANQVVHVALHVGQRVSRHARGDNGVVVGHLRIVEHLFALAQRCAAQGREQVAVDWCYAVENTFTFRIDVVREIRGVYARIGGELALVEALDDLQRLLGRIAELLVAFHLQPREVEEARRCFRAVFLGHGSHGERRSLNFGQCGASFLLRFEASAQRTLFVARRGGFFFFVVEHSGKERVAVGRGEHPVILGFEILNLLLPVHDKRERGRLHAAYGERLLPLPAVAAIF